MALQSYDIAGLSLVGNIAGALTSSIGSYYGAKLNQINLEHQAFMADLNARQSEKAAQFTMARGQQQIGQLTLNAGRLKSAQRAHMAANGIDLGQGNAAEIQASTDIMKESDVYTLNADTVRDAWAYRTQGTNYSNEALIKRSAAGAISPFASMSATLLGSAGSVAESWYRYKNFSPAGA